MPIDKAELKNALREVLNEIDAEAFALDAVVEAAEKGIDKAKGLGPDQIDFSKFTPQYEASLPQPLRDWKQQQAKLKKGAELRKQLREALGL